MHNSKSETDPLLPAYSPAPEIGHSHQHHHQHDLVHHDDDDTTYPDQQYPFPSQVGSTRPSAQQRWSNSGQDGADEIHSGRPTSTRGQALRTLFFGFWVLCFFVIVASFLKQYSDGGHSRNGTPGYRPPADPSRPAEPHRSVKDRVKSILASTPLIDGHDDLAIFIREKYKNNITSHEFRQDFENGTMPLNLDLPRLRAGQVGGAFWSAFVLCPANASYDMSDSNYATAVSHTIEQIDLLKRLQAQYPDDFSSPLSQASGQDSVSDRNIMLNRWHETKAFFGPISIEGLHQVPPAAPMSTLRHYYDLGVRMATLTWNCHNPFADASLVWNDFSSPPSVVNSVFRPKEGAVTNRGRKLIREMNRIGMIVDVSHTSYWTQKAVLSKDKYGHGISRAPVVFSHSSAYSVCPHPRNVKDDILDLVPDSKSLVMVNFSPDFVSCIAYSNGTDEDKSTTDEPHFSIPTFYPANNTLHQVARHIVYIGERIGYDYVGLGSDFDGMGKDAPKGLDGVDKFPDLVAELLEMGISDSDAAKVVGGNILRVWKDVEQISLGMKEEGIEPGIDDASGY